MTADEQKQIKKLSKCDFSIIHKYFVEKSEEKKNMTKEEKQVSGYHMLIPLYWVVFFCLFFVVCCSCIWINAVYNFLILSRRF